jgi:hypothetical protein
MSCSPFSLHYGDMSSEVLNISSKIIPLGRFKLAYIMKFPKTPVKDWRY